MEEEKKSHLTSLVLIVDILTWSAQCKRWWDSYCSTESTVEAPKPRTHKSEEGRNTWLLSTVIICKLLGEYSHIRHRWSQISRHVVLVCAAYKHKAGGASWVDGRSSPAETYARVIASHRHWAKRFFRVRDFPENALCNIKTAVMHKWNLIGILPQRAASAKLGNKEIKEICLSVR